MNFWFPLSILLGITAFYMGLSAFIVLRLLSHGFIKPDSRTVRRGDPGAPTAPAAIATTLLH